MGLLSPFMRWRRRSALVPPSPRRQPARIRPSLEVLEDRTVPSAGWLTPVGGETLINTTTAGTQAMTGNSYTDAQSVAIDPQGNGVVVWQGNGPGDADGIFFQRFTGSGNVGGEVLVNQTIAGDQHNALLAQASATGKFVVAWTFNNAAWARVYNADGSPVTGEMQVSGGGTNYAASVAMDADGDFVVLYWNEIRKGGNNSPTRAWYAQRYNADGVKQGSAIKVTTLSLINGTGNVAMDADGDFVVVWDETTGNFEATVNAQRYRKDGKKLGQKIQINADPGAYSSQWKSNVAMDSAGNFVVSWSNRGGTNVAQRVNANGTKVGSAFEILVPREERTALELLDNGDLVVAGMSVGLAPNLSEVYVQVFDAANVSYGAPLLVNTTTIGEQVGPSVAVDGSGNLLVVWSGNGVGDDSGVFGQRYTFPA